MQWVLLPGVVSAIMLWRLVAAEEEGDASAPPATSTSSTTPPPLPAAVFLEADGQPAACTLIVDAHPWGGTTAAPPVVTDGGPTVPSLGQQKLQQQQQPQQPQRPWWQWRQGRGAPTLRVSLSSLQVAEHAAKVPLSEHFVSSSEGVVSLRAFGGGAVARAVAQHHACADAHSAAWRAVLEATSLKVLKVRGETRCWGDIFTAHKILFFWLTLILPPPSLPLPVAMLMTIVMIRAT